MAALIIIELKLLLTFVFCSYSLDIGEHTTKEEFWLNP